MMQHDARMRYNGSVSCVGREDETEALYMSERHKCVTEKHVRKIDTEKD